MGSRLVLGLFLAICLGFVCLVVGAVIGALFLVPANSGLAGPAIALGHGLVGALLGVVVAVLLARWLPLPTLRRTLAASAAVALAGVIALGYRVWTLDPGSGSERGTPTSPYRHPYEVAVDVTAAGVAAGAPAVSELRLVQTPAGGRVQWTTTDLLPARCETAMAGLEGVDLAASLQFFAPRAAGGIRGCTHARRDAPLLFTIRWRASRELTSVTEGEMEIDGHCFQVFGAARDLMAQVTAIHDRATADATCNLTAAAPRHDRDPASPGVGRTP